MKKVRFGDYKEKRKSDYHQCSAKINRAYTSLNSVGIYAIRSQRYLDQREKPSCANPPYIVC